MGFSQTGLKKELLDELGKHNITIPTKIQNMVINEILAGHDIVAQSETGSGKTLGFALPLINNIQHTGKVNCLVLAPTRELAIQIAGEFNKFGGFKGLNILTVYGGVSLEKQISQLRNTDIVVGTPGRILDLFWRGHFPFDCIRYVVLDEADRMLDMGFVRDIDRILSKLPKNRQTLLFAATLDEKVGGIAYKYMKHPKNFRLDPVQKKINLTQYAYLIENRRKFALLAHLLKEKERKLSIVFCRTKRSTKVIARALEKEGISARSLSGDMTQNQRERTLRDFKDGKIDVLVATDVAGRGLHIENVSHVYNYDMPEDLDSFLHRVGRTARAGNVGDAIAFITDHDTNIYYGIKDYFKGRIKEIVPKNFPLLKTPFNARKNRDRFNPKWKSGKRSDHRGGFNRRKNYNIDLR